MNSRGFSEASLPKAALCLLFDNPSSPCSLFIQNGNKNEWKKLILQGFYNFLCIFPAKKCGISVAEASTNVDALVELMTDCLKENDQLNVSGFGILEVKMRNERLSVNPKTGQRFLVPPKIVPAFKPSNKLKDKFK